MPDFRLYSHPATDDNSGFLSIHITADVAPYKVVTCRAVDDLVKELETYAEEVRATGYKGGFVTCPTMHKPRTERKPAGYDKRYRRDLQKFPAPIAEPVAA